jgi:hypothetical protein
VSPKSHVRPPNHNSGPRITTLTPESHGGRASLRRAQLGALAGERRPPLLSWRVCCSVWRAPYRSRTPPPNSVHTVPNVAHTVPNVAHTVPNVAHTVPNVAHTVPNVAHTVPNVARSLPNEADTPPTVFVRVLLSVSAAAGSPYSEAELANRALNGILTLTKGCVPTTGPKSDEKPRAGTRPRDCRRRRVQRVCQDFAQLPTYALIARWCSLGVVTKARSRGVAYPADH